MAAGDSSSPPPARTRVQVHESEHHVTLTFAQNRIDGTGVREMYETTAELSQRRNLRLLVDLTEVPMVSSGALGILVAMKKLLLHTGGQLHIVVPDARVMEQFTISKLHLVLSLFPSVDEARSRFR
jgi:anti-anti-sigma factor